MNDTQSQSRPRAFRLQFSLKLLLLAFTAFAIGFPVWYRWPYEEIHTNPGTGDERVTTWQRQWGGGRLKHGVERRSAGATQMIVNSTDQIESSFGFENVETTTYREGRKDGPYEHHAGQNGLTGQYVDDLKDGVWLAKNGVMVTRLESWRRGKLDGPMEVRQPAPRPARGPGKKGGTSPKPESITIRLVFSDGRLTHFNGEPVADARGKSVSNRLFELYGSGAIDERTEAELGKWTGIDIVEMPLKDVAMYLSDTHNMPLVLDPKLGPKSDLPLTGSYQGIDLRTALLLLTAPQGLGCDYRYGCIWITTAEDGHDWRDPTGVTELKPPKGSALELAWNEISPPVDCVETPLTEVLAYLKQPLAIDIDATQIEETTANSSPPLITLSLRGVSFRDTLGQLLYRTHCRCRLDGDKLIIQPPDPH